MMINKLGVVLLVAFLVACGYRFSASWANSTARDTSLLTSTTVSSTRDAATTRHAEVRPILDALEVIEGLATQSVIDEDSDDSYGEAWAARREQRQLAYHGKIRHIVEQLETSKQVALLALACRALEGEQRLEDQDYDLVLNAAYWACVVRLHDGVLPDSAYRLDWLARKSHLQESDITMFYEITGRNLLESVDNPCEPNRN